MLEIGEFTERVVGPVLVHGGVGMREHVAETSPGGEAFGQVTFEQPAVGKPAEGLLVGGWRGQPGVRTEVHGKIHRRLRGNVERTEHHVMRIAARVQLGAAAAGAVRRGRSRGWSLRRDVAAQAERVSCPVTVQHRAMGSSTAALQPVFAKGT